MRIAVARQVLQSFNINEWNCDVCEKGTGLRKDREYILKCA